MAELAESQSSEFEDLSIDLPDLDETQIIEKEGDEREVSLFLEVKGGKVSGPELTPFVLPKRWTFQTLKNCVEDYINRRSDTGERRVKQLYYKRARGKSVVLLDSDTDISSLLDEYPLRHPTGKKKGRCIMYLAADMQDINDQRQTPRRSPRIRGRAYEIFVHEVGTDMKVSSNADILHKVASEATLEDITVLLKTYEDDRKLYTPAKGLYWLQKRTKQLVSLKSEQDLQACKEIYKGNLRLACHTVSLETPGDSNKSNKRKRKLDMQHGEKTGTQEQNELWNEIHVNLVRDLEKKGLLWRYGVKHLKLWTDLIMDGKCCGVGEEPQWEEHLEQVITPPKSKKRNPSSSSSSTGSTSPEDKQSDRSIIELMMLQHQQSMQAESRRAEMFQKTLLTMMSANVGLLQAQPFSGKQQTSSFVSSPSLTSSPSQSFQGKQLKNFNLEQCCNFLTSLGLGHLATAFQNNDVDGPLLFALSHPHFGSVMLNSMGFSHKEQEVLVKGIQSYL